MKRLSTAIVSWCDCLVRNEDESTIDTNMDLNLLPLQTGRSSRS